MMDWLVVSISGLLVGAGELVVRYRNAAPRELFSWPAFFYSAVYVVCALVALVLTRASGLTFGLNPQEAATELRITQILVAAFGSTLFLHSSLFSLRIGDQEVEIGPNSVRLAIRSVVDSYVARAAAQRRVEAVSRIMKGVSYTQALTLLPAYSLALAQDVSPEHQRIFSARVLQLDTHSGDPHSKIFLLGSLIADFVGVDVLEHATDALRASLTQPGLEEFTPERRVKLAGRLRELASEERAKFRDEALKSEHERLSPDQILKLVEEIEARRTK